MNPFTMASGRNWKSWRLERLVDRHLLFVDIFCKLASFSVNNVGVGVPYPAYFTELPGGEKFVVDMIRCNVIAQTMVKCVLLILRYAVVQQFSNVFR